MAFLVFPSLFYNCASFQPQPFWQKLHFPISNSIFTKCDIVSDKKQLKPSQFTTTRRCEPWRRPRTTSGWPPATWPDTFVRKDTVRAASPSAFCTKATGWRPVNSKPKPKTGRPPTATSGNEPSSFRTVTTSLSWPTFGPEASNSVIKDANAPTASWPSTTSRPKGASWDL